MTAKSILKLGKEYLLLTLGILIYVAGWTIFMIPNNLIGGGLTGVSSIIQYAVGIKMGYTYFVLNAILLVTAFVVIGANFSGKKACKLSNFLRMSKNILSVACSKVKTTNSPY